MLDCVWFLGLLLSELGLIVLGSIEFDRVQLDFTRLRWVQTVISLCSIRESVGTGLEGFCQFEFVRRHVYGCVPYICRVYSRC
jgi:hypothetical protein